VVLLQTTILHFAPEEYGLHLLSPHSHDDQLVYTLLCDGQHLSPCWSNNKHFVKFSAAEQDELVKENPNNLFANTSVLRKIIEHPTAPKVSKGTND
jgi:hypothetical protein